MNTPLLAFAAASVLAAWPAAPSQTDDAAFFIVSGSDTVFAERVSRTPTSFSGEFADRRRGGRMAYTVSLGQAGLVTHLTTRFYRSDADTTGASATFAIQGDSIVARVGDNAPAHVPGTLGTMPLVNPSVAFLEQLTIRARAMGGDQAAIPIFIIGTPQPLAATVTRVGADSMVLEYAGATMRLAVSPDGRILGGAVPAAQVSILRGSAGDAPMAAPRDYTAAHTAPYTSEDVVITTRTGLKLSGTLTIPRGRVGGRSPAVVTITGSGAQDRDGEPAALKGYRPFRELADTLGHRGIAVLRLDDRGVNGSEAGPKTATTKDFADDIAAAVMYLRKRREIDATRIALVGHSEGAVIAPMVSIADGQLRGIVLMAGWASLGRDIVRSQQHYVVDTVNKLTGKARDAALSRAQQGTDSVAKVLPWMKYYLDLEPAVIARQVETPALILHGENDHQVPSSEAERLATAFRTAGNRSVTVRLFPETNHLFVADAGGGFDYASLRSLRVRPAVLSTIADWLSERF